MPTADGYFAADHTSFWGAKSAEQTGENLMTPPQSDAGFVRMPEDEFEAMLARAAE